MWSERAVGGEALTDGLVQNCGLLRNGFRGERRVEKVHR